MPPDAARLADSFLEQSPACQWIVDEAGVFQRIFGDPSLLFGRPAAELEGRRVVEVLDGECGEAWTGRFARALAGETLALREQRPEATWYISVFPIRLQGAVRYAGGLAREAAPWSTAEIELRRTVLGVLKAQEYDRVKVSRFLHDKVGQNLSALGLQLDLVRMDMESATPEIGVRIGEMQQLLEVIMQDVRDYSYELDPSSVERAGLRAALDRLAGNARGHFGGTLRLNVDPSIKIDSRLAPAFFRIAEEAVDNALQHSGCSAIEIAVKSTRTGPSLEIRDNGRGFDPAEVPGGRRGLGMLSMEHHAAEAGLDLSISSSPENGTSIRAALPEGARE